MQGCLSKYLNKKVLHLDVVVADVKADVGRSDNTSGDKRNAFLIKRNMQNY
ncbi:hypothetical protein NTGM5_880008 [Candidatus Nitrotoga sp. M5]|nr:hypothetical protein NTGM5_880008 [Candidatus Nitrotoga sp. M5]